MLPLIKTQLIAWLLTGLLVLSAVSIFFELAGDVWLQEGFAWDAPLMLAIHAYGRPWLDQVMKFLTLTGNQLLIVLVGILAYRLWRRRQRRAAVTLAVSFIGATSLNYGLKLLFARPRPHIFPPLTTESSYSFPSGHTMAAAAVYGLLAVWLWRQRRYGWALVAGSWPLVVALTRIYLGVHYPSDVLASLAVGVVWLAAVGLVYDFPAQRNLR